MLCKLIKECYHSIRMHEQLLQQILCLHKLCVFEFRTLCNFSNQFISFKMFLVYFQTVQTLLIFYEKQNYLGRQSTYVWKYKIQCKTQCF